MTNKFQRILIVSLFVLLCSMGAAFSLGISVNKEVLYVPNKTLTLDICFRNSKEIPQEIRVTVEDDLKEFITLNFDELMTLSPKDTSCQTYTLAMPATSERAGLVASHIVATEVPKEAFGGGLQFNIIVSVKHRIVMRVPYPGKYIDFQIHAWNAKENEPAYFQVEGISRGTEILRKASARGSIIDYATKEHKSDILFTEAVNILTGEEFRLNAIWPTKGYPPGKYLLTGVLSYDEKSENFEKEFMIGNMEVEIADYTKQIYNGSVNPFSISLHSNWNDPINGVYADVALNGQGYRGGFRTPTVDLRPFSEGTISYFIDASAMRAGKYDMSIAVRYANLSTVENTTLEVLEPEKERASPFNTTNLLIAAIILLALANVFWFVMGRRKNEEKKQQ